MPVRLYRASSEDVAARVLEEARADQTRGDVAEASGLVMELLSDEGRLEPWEPAGADQLPPDALFEDWTAARTNRYVLGWNTERVPEDERPRSWDDLADPRWRGKLVMEVSDTDFARTLIEHWVSEGDSFEEAEERFEAIARNARFVDGHTLQAELLASGEFDAAAAAYAYLLDKAARQGAPVAWQPAVSPTVTRPNGPGVREGRAAPGRRRAVRRLVHRPGPGRAAATRARAGARRARRRRRRRVGARRPRRVPGRAGGVAGALRPVRRARRRGAVGVGPGASYSMTWTGRSFGLLVVYGSRRSTCGRPASRQESAMKRVAQAALPKRAQRHFAHGVGLQRADARRDHDDRLRDRAGAVLDELVVGRAAAEPLRQHLLDQAHGQSPP